jgi:tape measure domain-containing protein
MAMTLDTAIKFTAKLEGQGLDQLKRNLQGLAQQGSVSKRSLDQLYTATKALGAASTNTIAGLQKQATALRVLREQAEFGSRKFKLLSNDIDAVEARLRKFQGTAVKGAGIGRGEALLAGVAGGIAAQATQFAAQGAGAVVRVGLDAESARVRLRALTDEFGEYNQAQQAAARIAQTLRLSTTEAQSGFANLYAALRPTGVTIQEVEKAFIGFTAAARNSGATAQESSAALVQLKQALASGVLQGEELRSIREQAPLVAQAIAKEMGVSIGALKELASQGEVTSDVVLRALAKLSESQLGKLNAQFDTGTQALKDLSNAATELGTEVAKTFGPTAVALIRDFTRFIRQAGEVWGSLFGGDGEADARLQESIKARELALKDAQNRFSNPFGLNIGERESFLRQREAQIRDRLAQERVTRELKSDQLTPDQVRAQGAADKERESARAAARKKALEDETKARAQMEEKLADAAQRNAEQLADFRTETIKRAAQLERDLGDQRLQIERSIAEARRRIAEQEQDQALEAERQRLSAAGLSTEGIDAAKELGEISRRYSEQRIENEQNATDRQVQLQRQLEEFKTSVADGIGKIQEGYARSVSNILQDAGRKLGQSMVDGAQAAAGVLGGAGGAGGALGPSSLRNGSVRGGQLNVGTLVGLAKAAGFNDKDARIMAAIAMAESGGRSMAHNPNAATGDNSYGLWQINMLGGMGPERRRQFGIGSNNQLFDPATNANAARQVYQSQGFGAWSVYRSGAYRQFLPGAMGAQAQGPSAPMAGFNSAGLMGGIQRAGQQLGGAIGTEKAVKDQQAFNDLFGAYQQKFGQYKQDLDGVTRGANQQLQDQQRIYELMRSGLSPELAKQRVDAENTATVENERLTALEAQLDNELRRTDLTEQQRQQLKDLRAEVIARQMNEQGITEEILKQQQALEDLNRRQQALRDLTQSIGGTISEGIIGGIDAAIGAAMTGAKDLGDQLKQIAGGVLKDIGNALLRFGLNSLLGGAFGGNFFKFAQGGVMTPNGSLPLKRYAQGGVATRPQLALYGEGSKPEAYVPLPDGRRIPVALQGQDKMREVMGAGPTQGSGSPVLNMSFQTTNIGGVEYVSRDQLEAAMAETRRAASRDGARRGMTMTLDKLQQSPSTRTRVGLR